MRTSNILVAALLTFGTLTASAQKASPAADTAPASATPSTAQATAPPAVAQDPAMAPVKVADMQSVMKGDLERALESGALGPSTAAGLTIGIVQHGERRVLVFGTAKPDSIYEIGSLTKTFTGLILAQLVEQGRVKLDEPVRQLLPAGTVAKPTGTEISLLDLTTQHSGLPRMPGNFKPANSDNPYADYGAANLYQ